VAALERGTRIGPAIIAPTHDDAALMILSIVVVDPLRACYSWMRKRTSVLKQRGWTAGVDPTSAQLASDKTVIVVNRVNLGRFFCSESLIDNSLGTGRCLRFSFRYAHNRDTINRRRPSPDATSDMIDPVFDTSIFQASLIGRISGSMLSVEFHGRFICQPLNAR
jgi:hypothetical protein